LERLTFFILLITLSHLSIGQENNVALFFHTTNYQYGDSATYLDQQAKSIKDDLMFVYAFRASSYSNYNKLNFFNSITNECQADESKQLFVYIAGQSAFDEEGNGYLVLSDSDSLDFASMIPLKELGTLFNECKVKHLLVLIDVPKSGSLSYSESEIAPKDIIPRDSLSREDMISKGFERKSGVYYANNLKQLSTTGKSTFTMMGSKLLEVLRGYGGPDGIIDLEELDDFMITVTRSPRIGTFDQHEPGAEFLFIAR